MYSTVFPLDLETASRDPQLLALAFPLGTPSTQSYNTTSDLFGGPEDEMRDILSVLNANENDGNSSSEGPRLSPAEEAAEKRRKHREAMVLFRLRKKMNLEDMRKKEQTLLDVLQAKLRQYNQLQSRKTPTSADDLKMQELLDEFADVLTVKEALLRENRAMEGVIHELSKFQKLVHDEVERCAEEEAQAARASPTTRWPTSKMISGKGEWVHFMENEAPFLYAPVTTEYGERLVQEAFRRNLELCKQLFSRPAQTETYCLGWKAERSLVLTEDNKQRLQFRFTRQVPRRFMSMDDFKRIAWPVVTKPEVNTRLYSTPVHMKVLQWINEDSFITLRNSPHRDRAINFRYFSTTARSEFRDEKNRHNFIIHHILLDPSLFGQQTESSPVVWIKDGAQWMHFTELPESDSVEIEHQGYMQCINEEQARYLMIETCSILMRWEQIVAPPRMLRSE